MKQVNVKLIMAFVALAGLTSCLKKGPSTVDIEDLTAPTVQLQFIEGGNGTTINSGMQYFAGGALTYPATHTSDTADYNISIAGASPLTKDVTVTVGIDQTKVLDNFASDSITYQLMPDSLFKLLSTTAVIKAGTRTANLKVVFFPSKIDITKSYNLPLVVKDAQGTIISRNFGVIYFHVIGNPLAGKYLHDFTRYDADNPNGTKSSLSYTGQEKTFSPVNPTTIAVPTGYYTTIDYNLSFKSAGTTLSGFTAAFNKSQYDEKFVANGVTLVGNINLTVSADQKTFTFQYLAYNGAAYRYVIDKYTKK